MKAINESVIIKTTPDREYGLGKDGRAYHEIVRAKLIRGEYRIVTRWVQVHYASYERVKALELLKR